MLLSLGIMKFGDFFPACRHFQQAIGQKPAN